MQSTPSIKQYNIVLIGCGNMGAAHLDNIYTKDNEDLKKSLEKLQKALSEKIVVQI